MKKLVAKETRPAPARRSKHSPVLSPFGAQRNRVRQVLQPKLTIGQPNDRYEQEADRVADRVVAVSASPLAAAGAGNPDESGAGSAPGHHDSYGEAEPPLDCSCNDHVQRKSATHAAAASTPEAHRALAKISGPGARLSPAALAYFEPRFGHDFSAIRVHTGANADEAARLVNARAFTYGSHIAFARGQFDPGSRAGRWLLAHELTHTIQQGRAQVSSVQQSARGARRASGEEGEGGLEIEDTIRAIELALSVAAPRLEDESIPQARLARIRRLHDNLNSILPALRAARGTDGRRVAIGFDRDPAANEINPGDARRSIRDLYYPFSIDALPSTATEAPSPGQEAPRVQLKAVQGVTVSALSAPAIQRFCDPLVCLGLIVLGGLLLAGCSTRSGGTVNETRLREARDNFNSRNERTLTVPERDKIHDALEAVLGERQAAGHNLHLRIAFYDYFSNRRIRKPSAAALRGDDWTRRLPPSPSGEIETEEVLARTSRNSDLLLRPSVLESGFPDNRLGALLMHEFTHTRHPEGGELSRFWEGEAYAIEYFFAERRSDTQRMSQVGPLYHEPNRMVSGQGNMAAFRERFREFYLTMSVLYDIIDNGSSSVPMARHPERAARDMRAAARVVQGLNADQARQLSVELITTDPLHRSETLDHVVTFSTGAVLLPAISFDIVEPTAASED